MAPLVWAPYQPQAPRKPPYEIMVVATAMVDTAVFELWETSVWESVLRSLAAAACTLEMQRSVESTCQTIAIDLRRLAACKKPSLANLDG